MRREEEGAGRVVDRSGRVVNRNVNDYAKENLAKMGEDGRMIAKYNQGGIP